MSDTRSKIYKEVRERRARERAARAKILARLKWPVLFVGAVVIVVLLWRPLTGLIPAASVSTEVKTSPIDGMLLHKIPAGPFMMGSENGDPDEKPAHQVTLDAFWIDETEITNRMYTLCVAQSKCQPPADKNSLTRKPYYGESHYADYPVMNVSWNDAKTYCEWAGGELPSEAQWEKAARGPSGRTYPWGESIDCFSANYNNCSADTSKVGAYPNGRSFYGMADMAGNVAEWVADWYSDSYYASAPSSNPPGPDSGEGRVIRGGSLANDRFFVRSADRDKLDPRYGMFNTGFRCALSSP